VNTDMTVSFEHRGWIAFDDSCPLCRQTVASWGPLFQRRGFQFIPLSTSWVRDRLSLNPGEVPNEFKLLVSDGRILGGAGACCYLARTVWWMAPFGVIGTLPGISSLMQSAYAWVATRRQCLGDVCIHPKWSVPRHHAATTFLESP